MFYTTRTKCISSFLLTFFYVGISFTLLANPVKEYADSIRSEGLKHKKQGDYQQALHLYHTAQGQFTQLNLMAEVADCYNKIGVTHYRLSNFDSALYYYYQSLDLNDSLQNKTGLLYNYINLSNYYVSRHNPDLGFEFNKKGQIIALQLEDFSNLSLLYMSLGYAYLQNEYQRLNSDSAKHYFYKCLEINQRLGNQKRISGIYHNLGWAFETDNKLDSAYYYYMRSIQLNESLGLEVESVSIYKNLGNIELQWGRYKAAEKLFKEGLLIAENHNLKNQIQNISGNLAKLYETTGDYHNALAMHKMHKQYADSIFNEATAQQINELNTKYETEKTHKELAQAQVVIEQKNAERNIYLVSIAIILAFMIILVVIYQQRQHALKKLRTRDKDLHHQRIKELLLEQELSSLNAKMDGEEKERQRISKELHDRLGSILTTVKYNFESSNIQKEEDQELKNLINYALEETRNLSHTLASGVLAKFGLLAALNDLKNTIEADQSIAMTIDQKGMDNRIEQALEIDIYRITQELVSNTLKYAHAKEIILQLIVSDHKLNFMYEDDGIGFNVNQENQGIGLKNMQARTKKHHAEIHFDSQPGRGMRAIIDIELTHKDDKATVSG